MPQKSKKKLGKLVLLVSAFLFFSSSALATLDDLGGYHIRFVGERQCLSDIDEVHGLLTAWPCRTFDDDPAGRFDPFGPFYVLVFIRQELDHQWLEFRLSGRCVSVTTQLGQPRRPYKDVCRFGASDQKWEVIPESNSHYRVRHVATNLCLGHLPKARHVSMLSCQNEHTLLAITLRDPHPVTELPPYPAPPESAYP